MRVVTRPPLTRALTLGLLTYEIVSKYQRPAIPAGRSQEAVASMPGRRVLRTRAGVALALALALVAGCGSTADVASDAAGEAAGGTGGTDGTSGPGAGSTAGGLG